MQTAMSKTRERYPLSTKKVLKKTIAATFAWLIPLGIIYVALTVTFVNNSPEQAGRYMVLAAVIIFVLFLLALILNYLYQMWYYAVYYYDLHDDYIVIRKGPITPREITIPYERIQDVYVDQDLLDRIFGLYDVHLSSATAASGISAHIDGVEKAAADGLRGELLRIVGTRISKKGNGASPQVPTA